MIYIHDVIASERLVPTAYVLHMTYQSVLGF